MFNRTCKSKTNSVNSLSILVLVGFLLVSTILLTATALEFDANDIYYESQAQLAAIDAIQDFGQIPARFSIPLTADLNDSIYDHNSRENNFSKITAGTFEDTQMFDEDFTEMVLSELQTTVSTSRISPSLRYKLDNLSKHGVVFEDEEIIAIEYDFMSDDDDETPTFDPDQILYSAEGCVVKQISPDEAVLYEDGTQSSVVFYSDGEDYTLSDPKITTTPSALHQALISDSTDQSTRPHEPGCSDFICDWMWQLEVATFPQTYDEVPWSDYWANQHKYSANYKLWVTQLSDQYYAQHPEQVIPPINLGPGCLLLLIDFRSPTGTSIKWETDLWVCKQYKCSNPWSDVMGGGGNVYNDALPDECAIDNQGYADPSGVHSTVQDSGIIIAFHFNDLMRQVRGVIKSVVKQFQGQRIMFSSGWAGNIFLSLDQISLTEFTLTPKNGAMVFTIRFSLQTQLHLNTFIENSGVNLYLRDYRLTGSFVPTIKNGRFVINRIETHAQWDKLTIDTRGGLLQSTVIGLSGVLQTLRAVMKEVLGQMLPNVLHQTLAEVSKSIALSPQNLSVPIDSWSTPAFIDLSFSRPLLLDDNTSSLMIFLNGRTARQSDSQRFPQHFMKPIKRHAIGFTPRSDDIMDMLIDSFVFNDLLGAYFLTHQPSFTWSHLDQPQWLKDYEAIYDLLLPSTHDPFGTTTKLSLDYAPQINFSHQRAEIDAQFTLNVFTVMEPWPQIGASMNINIKAILDFKLTSTRKLFPRLNDLIFDFTINVGSDVEPVPKHLTLVNEFMHAMGTYVLKPVVNTALSTGFELPELGELAYVAELGFEQDAMWLAVKMRDFGY